MVKTQIELPDALYEAAKRMAQKDDVSIAQVVRRGVEILVRTSSDKVAKAKRWHPPVIRNATWTGLTPEQLRDLAQETTTEAQFKQRQLHAVR